MVSINKKIQNPLFIVLIIGILLVASGYHLDNVKTLTLSGKKLGHQDFKFDSHAQNLIKTIGLETEGVLLEWTEKNNLTRQQQTNESQCESNLVGDFDCDGIADPCPVYACIQ